MQNEQIGLLTSEKSLLTAAAEATERVRSQGQGGFSSTTPYDRLAALMPITVLTAITFFIYWTFPLTKVLVSFSTICAIGILLAARPTTIELLSSLLGGLIFAPIYLHSHKLSYELLPGIEMINVLSFWGAGAVIVLAGRAARRPREMESFLLAIAGPTLMVLLRLALVQMPMRGQSLDYNVYTVDLRLGIPLWAFIGELFRSHALVADVGWFIYNAMWPIQVLIFMLYLKKRRVMAANPFFTIPVAGVLGFLLYYVCPASGPAYAFGPGFSSMALGSAQLSWTTLAHAPRNAVPSLHAAWAFIAFWSTRGQRMRTRAAMLAFMLLTLMATLGTGEHYVTDLIVALPFAVSIQAMGERKWFWATVNITVTSLFCLYIRSGLSVVVNPWIPAALAVLVSGMFLLRGTLAPLCSKALVEIVVVLQLAKSYTTDRPSWRRREPAYLLAVAILAFVTVRQMPAIVHHDIYHQMALMRESLRLGTIPRVELYAYTSTIYPAIQHEWGAGLIALWMTTKAGAFGILALHFGIVALLLMVLLSAWRRQRISLGSVVLGLGIVLHLLLFGSHPVVAQSYSMVGLALVLRFLIADRLGRRWVVLFCLPLVVLWANIHAGFVLGIASLGAESLERMLRRERWAHLAGTAVAMIGLIALNPWGYQFYGYLAHALTMPRPRITGWNPKWLFTEGGTPAVVFALSIAVMGYAVWIKGWRDFRGFAVVLMLAVLSMRSERLLPLYAIAWAMTICPLLEGSSLSRKLNSIIETERGTFRVGCFAAIGTCVVLFFLHAPLWPVVPNAPTASIPESYPVGAVGYLKRTGFRGNLMTSFNSGAYVLWHLYPAVRVGCDSRHETAYADNWVLENQRLYADEPAIWKSIAMKYPTDAFLVERRFPLSKVLDGQNEWSRVYVDDSYAVYARPGLNLPYSNRIGDHIVGNFP